MVVGNDCTSMQERVESGRGLVRRPCTNVEILNLRCSSPSACIAIGSEMSGGIKNATVDGGLYCDQGDQALNVKSAVGRGGYVRNILFRDAVLGGGWALSRRPFRRRTTTSTFRRSPSTRSSSRS
jgi:polygalacturonase